MSGGPSWGSMIPRAFVSALDGFPPSSAQNGASVSTPRTPGPRVSFREGTPRAASAGVQKQLKQEEADLERALEAVEAEMQQIIKHQSMLLKKVLEDPLEAPASPTSPRLPSPVIQPTSPAATAVRTEAFKPSQSFSFADTEVRRASTPRIGVASPPLPTSPLSSSLVSPNGIASEGLRRAVARSRSRASPPSYTAQLYRRVEEPPVVFEEKPSVPPSPLPSSPRPSPPLRTIEIIYTAPPSPEEEEEEDEANVIETPKVEDVFYPNLMSNVSAMAVHLSRVSDALQSDRTAATAQVEAKRREALRVIGDALLEQDSRMLDLETLTSNILRAAEASLGVHALQKTQTDRTAEVQRAHPRLAAILTGERRGEERGGEESESIPTPKPKPIPVSLHSILEQAASDLRATTHEAMEAASSLGINAFLPSQPKLQPYAQNTPVLRSISIPQAQDRSTAFLQSIPAGINAQFSVSAASESPVLDSKAFNTTMQGRSSALSPVASLAVMTSTGGSTLIDLDAVHGQEGEALEMNDLKSNNTQADITTNGFLSPPSGPARSSLQPAASQQPSTEPTSNNSSQNRPASGIYVSSPAAPTMYFNPVTNSWGYAPPPAKQHTPSAPVAPSIPPPGPQYPPSPFAYGPLIPPPWVFSPASGQGYHPWSPYYPYVTPTPSGSQPAPAVAAAQRVMSVQSPAPRGKPRYLQATTTSRNKVASKP